jgi:ubiquinone/menaquinone biosynthesis C-methylase UbiE
LKKNWVGKRMQRPMIYDRYAGVYDKLLSPLERAFLSQWRKELIAKLPSVGPIIEIGAGTGLNFKYFSNISELVATDLSLEMLRFARDRNPTVKIVKADACRIPFQDDFFAAAIGTLVLCSVDDPEEVFGELRRVVREDGVIVFLEHVRPSGPLGPMFDLLNIATTRLIGDCFNRRTSKLLKNFGFEIVQVEKKLAGVVNLIHCRNRK